MFLQWLLSVRDVKISKFSCQLGLQTILNQKIWTKIKKFSINCINNVSKIKLKFRKNELLNFFAKKYDFKLKVENVCKICEFQENVRKICEFCENGEKISRKWMKIFVFFYLFVAWTKFSRKRNWTKIWKTSLSLSCNSAAIKRAFLRSIAHWESRASKEKKTIQLK